MLEFATNGKMKGWILAFFYATAPALTLPQHMRTTSELYFSKTQGQHLRSKLQDRENC